MKFINKLILCGFLLVISGVECSIKIPDHGTPKLYQNARELAKMCFKKDRSPNVISGDLLGNDWEPGNDSLIVIDREYKKQLKGFLSAYPTYVLLFESWGNLKAAINHLQKSTLWSIKSPFLIVDTDQQCADAAQALGFMWSQDLLAVYYLCQREDSTIVFTVNPFSSYAPAPWFQIVQFDRNEKKLALFGMKYQKDKKICESLTFDKTQKLNGHVVKIAAFIDLEHIPLEKLQDEIKKSLGRMTRKKIMSVYKLLSHINTSTSTNFAPLSERSNSLRNGYIKNLVHKTNDIADGSFQLADTNYKYVDVLAQYDEATFSILTKKSEYLTTISQVACNYQFLVLTIIVLMLIAVIVIINNKFDISGSILDVMSMAVNMGVLTPMDRLSMRIIYCFSFLFIFTVMPEFQGQVSAILSKPLRRNVESLKDLYDSKYHVFFDSMLINDMLNENLWITGDDKQYLHPSKFSELGRCAYEAQFNSTIACIQFRSDQLTFVSEYNNLHLSKDVIFKKYYVNWVRKGWSLKEKLDKISSQAVESGLWNRGRLQTEKYYLKKLRKAKRIEDRGNFEFITFDDLVLSYMIVFGLSLWGLVVFGFELLFYKYDKRRWQILRSRRITEMALEDYFASISRSSFRE